MKDHEKQALRIAVARSGARIVLDRKRGKLIVRVVSSQGVGRVLPISPGELAEMAPTLFSWSRERPFRGPDPAPGAPPEVPQDQP